MYRISPHRLCLSGYTYTVVASSMKEGVING